MGLLAILRFTAFSFAHHRLGVHFFISIVVVSKPINFTDFLDCYLAENIIYHFTPLVVRANSKKRRWYAHTYQILHYIPCVCRHNFLSHTELLFYFFSRQNLVAYVPLIPWDPLYTFSSHFSKKSHAAGIIFRRFRAFWDPIFFDLRLFFSRT